MRIAVAGSIATDHLMVFPGRFAEQLIAEAVERVSLSFLADRLEVREGGVGANICVGLGRLGIRPVLVGAAGIDFAGYGNRLRRSGVDIESVRVSETLHTARFVCTTDEDQNQIATVYAGAMAEARQIDLAEVHRRVGGLDLVVIGADDPDAMLRHTATAHTLGVRVAADPSQQLARLDEDQTRQLIDGAHLLFTNEYEQALLLERTGWTREEVLSRVGAWLVTRGADGVSILVAGREQQDVPAVSTDHAVDPTGVGDAFRAGFLAGLAWKLPYDRAAQIGCALATVVIETVGTQEYKLLPTDLLTRIDHAYGHVAALAIGSRLADAS
ncbi:carbohydrate kinase family protein [Streptomyces sp. NPDC005963]|uniref:carbohydrate kinase family protein n=1 Tax=Streptomyces sp. NPDC005963 TaxID=3156721 RepID=UPI003404D4AA